MTDPAPTDPSEEDRPSIDAARAADLTGEQRSVAGPPNRGQFRRARARRHLRRRRRLAAIMIVLGVALIAAAVWRWWTLASDSATGPSDVPAAVIITVV